LFESSHSTKQNSQGLLFPAIQVTNDRGAAVAQARRYLVLIR